MGACGAADLVATTGWCIGYLRPGQGHSHSACTRGSPHLLHSLTPSLLGKRPVLLSFPHAQVWKACFQTDALRQSWRFKVHFTKKLKASRFS